MKIIREDIGLRSLRACGDSLDDFSSIFGYGAPLTVNNCKKFIERMRLTTWWGISGWLGINCRLYLDVEIYFTLVNYLNVDINLFNIF